jgi:hypothetical protein
MEKERKGLLEGAFQSFQTAAAENQKRSAGGKKSISLEIPRLVLCQQILKVNQMVPSCGIALT